ncbi:MAG: sensor domain-containing diguanylate cyclase [Gammaproteobacteria bacterium]|nr:sensor domain-containing diguanylate cyclase [Gammaproteobacteria bacterium]
METFTTELAVLDSHIDELVNRIQVNDQKWKQLQNLEAEFLYRTSLSELIEFTLDNSLLSFGVDIVSLVLLDTNDELNSYLEDDHLFVNQRPNLLFLDSELVLKQLFGKARRAYVGPFQTGLHEFFFSDEFVDLPKSLAILPLYRRGGYIGAMALGSQDNDRFSTALSTEFLDRLALIAGVCFENTISIELLKRTSFIDPLTRINNRRYFDQRLGEEVDRALRSGDSLSCLFLDIDYFKKVNDTYGHQSGDIVIQHIAQMMRPQLRSADVLARYGGEEFVAMITGATSQMAIDVAERIRKSVARRKIDIGHQSKISITVSIGVATFTPKEFSGSRDTIARTLLGQADEALFDAKRGGRNRVEYGGVLKDVHANLVSVSSVNAASKKKQAG